MNRFKNVVAPALLVVIFGAILFRLPIALADRSSEYVWFNPIIEARRILLDRFVEEIDQEELQQNLLSAMAASLGDPYTVYVPPADEEQFQKDLTGMYVGIGAEVNIVDNYLTIVTPLPDSPAVEAGVLPGDVVLEIEGESTFGLSVQECINRLLGEEGTDVKIRVRHLDGTEQDLTITRRRIVSRTLRGMQRIEDGWDYWLDPDDGIAYLRLTQFIDRPGGELNSFREVVRAVSHLSSEGMKGLVFDLRDNPGGSLESAINIADLFLDDGVIVSVRSPRSGQERSWSAQPNGVPHDFHIVAIVNQASASGSEIFAGALRDNNRAKVLGTRTFGKGSVQEIRRLQDHEGTLKFTTAYYHLPSGQNIHRLADSTVWGVDPDPAYVVPMTDEEYVRMIRKRRPFEVLGQTEGEAAHWHDYEWIRDDIGDKQLALALYAIQQRIAEDRWPSRLPGVEETDPSVAAIDQEVQRLAETRNRMVRQLSDLDARITEMRAAGAEIGLEPMVPDDVDWRDGTVTLHDREGRPIGEFRIVGGDLPLALQSLRLEKIDRKED